jgi:hypothetical protein
VVATLRNRRQLEARTNDPPPSSSSANRGPETTLNIAAANDDSFTDPVNDLVDGSLANDLHSQSLVASAIGTSLRLRVGRGGFEPPTDGL